MKISKAIYTLFAVVFFITAFYSTCYSDCGWEVDGIIWIISEDGLTVEHYYYNEELYQDLPPYSYCGETIHYSWAIDGQAYGGDSYKLVLNPQDYDRFWRPSTFPDGWPVLDFLIDRYMWTDPNYKTHHTSWMWFMESYVDVTPLKGDFTIQLLDPTGTFPVGPEKKTLTVCPGAWVRLKVKNVHDTDKKKLRGEILSDPLCDGWNVHIKGELISGTSEYIKDVKVVSTGQYTCCIEDTPPTTPKTFEYDDPDFVDTVNVKVEELKCDPAGTHDHGGSAGCGSCSGGGGGLSTDRADGTIEAPEAPGASDGGSLRICGVAAIWNSPCRNCSFFEYVEDAGMAYGTASIVQQSLESYSWKCTTDPSIKLSVGGTSASITLSDSTVYNYTIKSEEAGLYYPSSIVDSSGRTTSYDYDTNSGTLLSVTGPDGRTTSYEHKDGRFGASVVKGPDNKIYKRVEYGTGVNAESPTAMISVDPDDPDNQNKWIRTSYTYDTNGKVTSTTANSGLKTEVSYANGKVHWMWTLNESEGKLYSQTEYTYSTSAVLDYDSQAYSATTTREYYNANQATLQRDTNGAIIPVATDIKDRIETRYYYNTDTFLRAVKAETGDGICTNKVVYDVNTTSGALYGKVTAERQFKLEPSEAQVVKSLTEYEYYDPDTDYQIPHNASGQDDQYYVTTPASVPYATGNDVNGNGQVQKTTVTIGSTVLTTTYRYMIKSVDGILTMTPYTTIIKDTEDHISKSVQNDDGSTAEVWQENESGTLEKIKSYTYYSTPDTHKGLVNTETVYNVASSGTNRDMVTTYTYAFDNGTQTVTATCGGRSTVSHYNILGQMEWTKDELNRQTDYQYDYQGRLLTTTYPAVDGVRKTKQNFYTCCHLEKTVDENDHHTYYDYDGKGNVVGTYTDTDDHAQSSDYPLVKYSFAGPFGAQDKVTTSDSNHSRDTIYHYTQGRITKIEYPNGLIGPEEFRYDEYGKLILKKDGNGIITAYDYDDLDRMSAIDYEYEGQFQLPLTASIVEDVSYEYDGATSKVLEVTDDLGTAHYTYYHDGKIKTYTPAVPSGYGTISYEYNMLGQKTSMIVPLGVGNKGRKFVYTYDNTGRQIDTEGVPVTVTSSTSLETITASSQTRFYYDDDKNRVKLINKIGGVYYFVYDPTASIPAVVYEQGPNNRYLNVREPDGSLISRETYNSNGERTMYRMYHFDGLGSTIALSDESGSVTDRYTYDAWGNLITHAGSVEQPYQYVGRYGYYTHYQEPDCELVLLGERFYDSEIGRFTSRDAISRYEWSSYLYADGCPTTLIDEWGLKPTFTNCSSKQIGQLQKQLDDIAKNRVGRLSGGASFQECMKKRLNNVVIVCESSCGGESGWTDIPTPRNTIHVCPDAIAGKQGCPGKTLIHEMAHSCTPHKCGPKPGDPDPPEGWQAEWDAYCPGSPTCPK